MLVCLQISLGIIPIVLILFSFMLLFVSLSSRLVILTLEIGDVMIAVLLSKQSHLVHLFTASRPTVLPSSHHDDHRARERPVPAALYPCAS